MRIENANASDVLERILSAYGFTMQKELAERLEIAKSNVAGWLQRGQIPGNVIVQCALDTGADVNWIVSGKLAKANFEVSPPVGQGKALYDEIMSNGGKPVLRRILDAYGFTLQKQLCDLLDISSGTVSTWVRRAYFPGDVVVACALDTGASLQWLATGKGMQKIDNVKEENHPSIPRKNLNSGVLQDVGSWSIDLSFISQKITDPIFIFSNTQSWIVDAGIISASNGRWLLSVNGKYDVYDIALLPNNRINVKGNKSEFICGQDEVKIEAKVIFTLGYNF